jgi:hypothetical protein
LKSLRSLKLKKNKRKRKRKKKRKRKRKKNGKKWRILRLYLKTHNQIQKSWRRIRCLSLLNNSKSSWFTVMEAAMREA